MGLITYFQRFQMTLQFSPENNELLFSFSMNYFNNEFCNKLKSQLNMRNSI